MQSQIALLVCSFFIFGILIADSKRKPTVSVTLWIPLIWLVIVASQPVTLWLYPSQRAFSTNIEEGSSIDRIILSVLIIIAVFILFKRKLYWTHWLRENQWLFLFFLYCGISVGWSDFPGIALKRWFRALGSLIMILVVLSEANPVAAVGTLVRRCTYILVPLSILLNKYYREMAVVYNQWTGEEYLAGATTDKNALGRLCLISGIFMLWDIITTKHNKKLRYSKINRIVAAIMFLMTLWLSLKSKSSTSLASLLIGSSILMGLGVPIVRKKVRYIGTYIFLIFSILLMLILSSNFIEVVVLSLGRDMTFTDRTYVWEDLLAMRTDPFFGVGYNSFWLGKRLEKFEQKHQVNEAHNGYLEVYLELGMIGLFLFVGFLFSTFWKSKNSLLLIFDYGRLRMVLLFIFVLYNITEASYKITTSMSFIFTLVAIDPQRKSQSQIPVDTTAKPIPMVRYSNRLGLVIKKKEML